MLYEYGFGYVWINDGVGNCSQVLNCFKQRLIDYSLQNLQQKIRDLPKSKCYQHFKSLLNVEMHLSMDISYYSRRILSNSRCSSHCLNVERVETNVFIIALDSVILILTETAMLLRMNFTLC